MTTFSVDLSRLVRSIMIGKEHLIPPKMHKTRVSPEYIIYYITSGNLELKDNNKRISLGPGDFYCFNKGEFHEPVCSTDCGYYYLHLEGDIVKRETDKSKLIKRMSDINGFFLKVHPYDESGYKESEIIIPKKIHIDSQTVDRKLCKLFENGGNTKNVRKSFYKFEETAVVTEILLLISRVFSDAVLRESENLNSDIIIKITEYLDENIEKRITGDILAEKIGYSFDYMNRRFKSVTGQPIFVYLQELRIQKAKMLLISSPTKLSEIAEKCGFCDAYYFSRAFKKATGVTPKNFTKQ